jgi:hypothetical protein
MEFNKAYNRAEFLEFLKAAFFLRKTSLKKKPY